jgi:distribution and morphology protein 31
MDLRIHLNDVRAAVPLFTKDISYVRNALIRPIVAYINSRRTFIPINCRVVKRASEFDGSWTIFDSGLMDDLSAEVSLLLNVTFCTQILLIH